MRNISKEIFEHLEVYKINYQTIDHEAAQTCDLAAKARGLNQEVGGKTLFLKAKSGYALFSLSAVKELDSQKARRILKSQKLRFASTQELKDLMGVEKGALPPFGRPFYQYDLYLDDSLFENELIAFNAGILTKSVVLKFPEYLKVTDFQRASFAKSGR